MSVGLRELLGLPKARQATTSKQVDALRQQFSERMTALNDSLQLIAGQAPRKDFQSLDSQRMKLYEAFQKTSALVDTDPSTGKESVKRMLTALESIQAKAAETSSGITAGREKWLAREDEFDRLVVRIGELEDAGNPKAAPLRKLADSIRARANERDYGQSVAALDQLRPKFDQIYQQHQQGASNGSQAGAAPQAGAATGFINGSVGKGGKNSLNDVKAVQEALNQRGGAKLNPDGKFGPKTLKAIEEFQKRLGQFKPDGLIEPRRGSARVLSGAAQIPPMPPEPKPIAPPMLGKATLEKGSLVWHSTRDILNTNIEELKKGVRAHYGTEHRDLLTQIDQNMMKLSSVLDKLDTRLADALECANNAATPAARTEELKKAQIIMKEYIRYVNSEPLIIHMDKNPFGVKTNLQRIISDALKHLTQLFPLPAGKVA